ncbi:MAG: hypothetical protein HQL22_12065, partial [Candidatus Omnitrophica bacterium]|nr:hypothetical protein [Candidatus Omnitrophota bacterium]
MTEKNEPQRFDSFDLPILKDNIEGEFLSNTTSAPIDNTQNQENSPIYLGNPSLSPEAELLSQFPDLAPGGAGADPSVPPDAALAYDGQFSSRFSAWIRAVALTVVCIFIPDQIGWAFNYNPAIIWGSRAPITAQAPGMTPAEMSAMQVSGSVDHLLTEVNRQKAERIDLKLDDKKKDGQSLAIQVAAKFNPADIKQVTSWLSNPKLNVLNCGVYALQDILADAGIKKSLEELAVMTIATDLFSNVIKAGEPKLKISLFSISQAAKAHGLNYSAARMAPADTLTLPTPFIAHFKEEHFVTVTKVSDSTVYFNDIGKADQMPRADFTAKMSGVVLAKNLKYYFNSAYQPVSDTTLTYIWGNKWRDRSGDLVGLMTMGQVITGVVIDLVILVVSIGIAAWVDGAAEAGKAVKAVTDITTLLQKIAYILSRLGFGSMTAVKMALLGVGLSKILNALATMCVMEGACSEKTAFVLTIAITAAVGAAVGASEAAKAAAAEAAKRAGTSIALAVASVTTKDIAIEGAKGFARGLVSAVIAVKITQAISDALDCKQDDTACQVLGQTAASIASSIGSSLAFVAGGYALDQAASYVMDEKTTFFERALGVSLKKDSDKESQQRADNRAEVASGHVSSHTPQDAAATEKFNGSLSDYADFWYDTGDTQHYDPVTNKFTPAGVEVIVNDRSSGYAEWSNAVVAPVMRAYRMENEQYSNDIKKNMDDVKSGTAKLPDIMTPTDAAAYQDALNVAPAKRTDAQNAIVNKFSGTGIPELNAEVNAVQADVNSGRTTSRNSDANDRQLALNRAQAVVERTTIAFGDYHFEQSDLWFSFKTTGIQLIGMSVGQAAGGLARWGYGGDAQSLESKAIGQGVAGVVSYGAGWAMEGAAARAEQKDNFGDEIAYRVISGAAMAGSGALFDWVRESVIGKDDKSQAYAYNAAQYNVAAGMGMNIIGGAVLGTMGAIDDYRANKYIAEGTDKGEKEKAVAAAQSINAQTVAANLDAQKKQEMTLNHGEAQRNVVIQDVLEGQISEGDAQQAIDEINIQVKENFAQIQKEKLDKLTALETSDDAKTVNNFAAKLVKIFNAHPELYTRMTTHDANGLYIARDSGAGSKLSDSLAFTRMMPGVLSTNDPFAARVAVGVMVNLNMAAGMVYGTNYIDGGINNTGSAFRTQSDFMAYNEHMSGMAGVGSAWEAVQADNQLKKSKKDNAALPSDQRMSDEDVEGWWRLRSVDRHRLNAVNFMSDQFSQVGATSTFNLIKTANTYMSGQYYAARTTGSMSLSQVTVFKQRTITKLDFLQAGFKDGKDAEVYKALLQAGYINTNGEVQLKFLAVNNASELEGLPSNLSGDLNKIYETIKKNRGEDITLIGVKTGEGDRTVTNFAKNMYTTSYSPGLYKDDKGNIKIKEGSSYTADFRSLNYCCGMLPEGASSQYYVGVGGQEMFNDGTKAGIMKQEAAVSRLNTNKVNELFDFGGEMQGITQSINNVAIQLPTSYGLGGMRYGTYWKQTSYDTNDNGTKVKAAIKGADGKVIPGAGENLVPILQKYPVPVEALGTDGQMHVIGSEMKLGDAIVSEGFRSVQGLPGFWREMSGEVS